MCGFFLFVGDGPEASQEHIHSRFQSVCAPLRRRGPDSLSVEIDMAARPRSFFVQSRLAIISRDPRENLPIRDENEIFFYNGEIYNTNELIGYLAELGHTTKTKSDAEILQIGLKAEGKYFLSRVNGQFAYCSFDFEKRKINFGRDRFGEKPLYFHVDNGKFIISSSLLSIFSFLLRKPKIAKQRVMSDLSCNFFSDKDSSHVEGVRNAQPGQCYHYDCVEERISTEEYYSLEQALKLQREFDLEDFALLFSDAVRARVPDQSSYGLLLSGGIDSALIARQLSFERQQKLDTFTLFSKSLNDADQKAVDAFYEKYGSKFRRHDVEISPEYFTIDEVMTTLKAVEEPMLDRVYHYLRALYSAVGDVGHRVAFSGQGSDEIGLGYLGYYTALESVLNSGISFGDAIAREFQLWNTLAEPELMRELIQIATDCSVGRRDISPELEVSTICVKNHLPALLAQEDKLSMFSGVECRTVFTDHRIVEFMMSRSCQQRSKMSGKIVLKRFAGSLLPDDLIHRKKVGFPIFEDPVDVVLRSSEARSAVENSRCLNEVFTSEYIETILDSDAGPPWNIAMIALFEKQLGQYV